MSLKVIKNTVLLFVLVAIACASKSKNEASLYDSIHKQEQEEKRIIVGANQTDSYLELLNGKRVGIVANQTTVIFKNTNENAAPTSQKEYSHLVDSLLALDIEVKRVFAPEHGFRGQADAGEIVKDGIDIKTGLSIISLYGKNKKPSPEQLENLDVIIFDIQDIGVRFYTYISTLHYVMEACAEQNIPLIVFDRPNPNAHYIDGPILEQEHQSFVGMHPVPVVHGMTIGEYAKMINGEGWLDNGIKCDLKVIPVKNYSHKTPYSLPIKPSPNLPNDISINLYPSLCLFEGTNVSIGRGTNQQFQVVGSPFYTLEAFNYEFTPYPNEGARYPKHEGLKCFGYDLSKHPTLSGLNLSWLIEFYDGNKENSPNKGFFTDFFTKLAGTEKLQQQIESGLTEKEIKSTWSRNLMTYQTIRKGYLIYKD